MKRYAVWTNGGIDSQCGDENGEWVRYDEAAAIERERDEARRMLHEERIRHRQKVKKIVDMARYHPMARGELDNANARIRQQNTQLEQLITERDALRAKLDALKAQRCDGCKHWEKVVVYFTEGEVVSTGSCKKLITDYNGPLTRMDFGCTIWEAK